ncbi:porin [Pedobacter sp. MW01-1-1]|uniref:porin n=1 Tax=Pedobacter sp. MW01-1-1 TaxID=3383027 RepID=UPI003FEF930F
MKKYVLLLILSAPVLVWAQNNNSPSSYDPHDIAITGYFQTQYQKAQSPGITSFSGGDFSTNSDSRFMIRRGRLKIDRVDKYTSIVFQIDATQNGLQLMDGFIQVREPSFRTIKFTAGLFNRPFGHAIVYSSGYRDFPERPRIFQLLMPRERDIGALLGYHPHKALKFLTLELAMVNGSGLTARDYDSKKDLIGNMGFKFDSLANKKFHLGFGASIYQGYVRSDTKTFYAPSDNGFIEHTNDNIKGNYLNRDYYGVNLQLQYDNSFGKTTIKSEYLQGKQPGVAGTNVVKGPYASQSFSAQPTTNLYARNFNGYYIWFIQEVGKTKLSAICAYDVYDPNTDVKGMQIGNNNLTTSGDVRYATLGYGLTYQFNKRLKLTLYNEHVKNESTSLAEIPEDIKDNVFTTRLQYRW